MNQPIKRGGKRAGAGRPADYLKRCEVYATQLALGCCKRTAQRYLSSYGRRNIVHVVGNAAEFAILDRWHHLTEFDRGMVYGILNARVNLMLAVGFGRR